MMYNFSHFFQWAERFLGPVRQLLQLPCCLVPVAPWQANVSHIADILQVDCIRSSSKQNQVKFCTLQSLFTKINLLHLITFAFLQFFLYSSCLGLSMCAMPLACWWMVFRCFTLLSHFSFLCGFPKGSLVWFGLVGYMRHPRWCSAPKTIYPSYWQKILQATLWSQRSCLLWLSFWLQ